jgi:hypothetical protein
MRAILWIFTWSLIAFSIHLGSFVLIPPTRGPTVRASHAALHVAEKVLHESYVTDYNPAGEYPRGSLHANWAGQKVLIVFWLLAYLLVSSLIYSVVAGVRSARGPRELSNQVSQRSTEK